MAAAGVLELCSNVVNCVACRRAVTALAELAHSGRMLRNIVTQSTWTADKIEELNESKRWLPKRKTEIDLYHYSTEKEG